MNKKIIILTAAIIIVIGALILLKDYIKPYSLTGDKNAAVNVPQAADEVNIRNFAFLPAILKARIGVKVVWKQNDQATHKIVSREGLFASNDLSSGDEFSFIFAKAGEYDYYCAIHPSMRGKIIIE